MTLPDWQIEHAIESGELGVKPVDLDKQLQPASLDVRLGNEFRIFRGHNMPDSAVWKTFDLPHEVPETTVEDTEKLHLEPGDFKLAHTLEHISLPADILGRVEGRSSFGRLGIAIHVTAGFVDPGYVGQITLEIKNMGDAPVSIEPGQRVAQLALERLDTPAEEPYGEREGSKYQGQTGAQASRLDEDEVSS